MNVEIEITKLQEQVKNLQNAPELAPAVLELVTKVSEFKGVVDGLAINQSHAEDGIKDLKVGKQTVWDRLNDYATKFSTVAVDIKELQGEDKVIKNQLSAGHRVMVWISLIASILMAIKELLGG